MKLVVALALAGCVNVPAFKGNPAIDAPNAEAGVDGGPPPPSCTQGGLAYAVEDPNIHVICGPNYVLRFSNEGAHYPYSMNVGPGGTQILGGHDNDCADESGMGIAIQPAGIVGGVGASLGPAPILVMNGPAVIKLQLEWTFANTCTNGNVTGKSQFSFFRDGRIARYDIVDVENQMDSTTCSCGTGGSDWTISSFTSLNVGTIMSSVPSVPLDGNETQTTSETNGPRSACVAGTGYDLGFAWQMGPGRFKRTSVSPGNGGVAVTRDMVWTGDGRPDHSIVPPVFKETHTEMMIGSMIGCPKTRLVNDVARAHVLVKRSLPSGASEDVPIGGDGIYGGEYALENPSNPKFVEAGEDAELTAHDLNGTNTAIPPGWVVKLHFLGAIASGYSITGPNDTPLVEGTDYFLQRNTTDFDHPSDGAYVEVWFRDSLPEGSHVRIHPL